jgi:hypothetical protein
MKYSWKKILKKNFMMKLSLQYIFLIKFCAHCELHVCEKNSWKKEHVREKNSIKKHHKFVKNIREKNLMKISSYIFYCTKIYNVIYLVNIFKFNVN